MAHAVGDAHPYPIYGAHFLVAFPILDADGDFVTGATGLDSERSIDLGAFADCTNEAVELATASGKYYLYLTGAEMTGKFISVQVKTTSPGAKSTPIELYPRRLPVLESGTAQAGAAGTITLAAGAVAIDDYYNGLYVLITNNSPAGAQYQARRIIDYVGSTRVATIESNWGTNPSSASTYSILVPDGVSQPWIASGVWGKTMTELAAVPGVTASMEAALEWLFLLARNKLTQTATTQTLRNDADSGNIATSTLSDDGVTLTRGEFT